MTPTPRMKREIAIKMRHLIQYIRPAWMSDVFGFVIDESDDLILVHSFNSAAFCLNGYEVLRKSDIREFCIFDDPRYWRFRALGKLKIKPTPPTGISIRSMPELLASAAKNYPEIAVIQETRTRQSEFIGPILSMSKQTFTMQDSNYYGQWTGPRRVRYEDVTGVIFDDGFLKASALASPPPAPNPSSATPPWPASATPKN